MITREPFTFIESLTVMAIQYLLLAYPVSQSPLLVAHHMCATPCHYHLPSNYMRCKESLR